MSRWQFAYLPPLLLASLLMLLKGMAYARILDVDQFGQLNALLLAVTTFVNVGALGFNHLAHKLLPRLYVQRDAVATSQFIITNLAVYCITVITILGIAGIAYTLVSSPQLKWIPVISLTSLAQSLFALKLIAIKSELTFSSYAGWSFLRALALSCAGIATAAMTRSVTAVVVVEGLVTGALAGPFLAQHLSRFSSGCRQATRFIWQSFSRHARAAATLLVVQGTVTVLYMIDRWVGVVVLSTREYGIYSVGLIVLTAFETLQSVIGVPAYPVLSRMILTGDRAGAFRLCLKMSGLVLAIALICALPAVVLLKMAVRAYLPSYVESLSILGLMVLGGSVRVGNFFGTFCILVDEEWRMVKLGTGIIAVVIVTTTMLQLGLSIQLKPIYVALLSLGVSLAMLVGYFWIARRAVRADLHPVIV
jgi:O-antigen/teichoic acid export membrane protein